MNATDQVNMSEQYADSDSSVKAPQSSQFRIGIEDFAIVHEMPIEEDGDDLATQEATAVSDFIRRKIDEWKASGGTYKDLAKQAGMAPSMISQIQLKTSAATLYTASKLARPLGFADLEDLVTTALSWWRSSDRDATPGSRSASFVQALETAKEYALTTEQVDRVVVRFPLKEFGDREASWWLARFLEAKHEHDVHAAQPKKVEQQARVAKRRAQRKGQAEMRAVKEAQREAERKKAAAQVVPLPARRVS